jgi:hypothetical protein
VAIPGAGNNTVVFHPNQERAAFCVRKSDDFLVDEAITELLTLVGLELPIEGFAQGDQLIEFRDIHPLTPISAMTSGLTCATAAPSSWHTARPRPTHLADYSHDSGAPCGKRASKASESILRGKRRGWMSHWERDATPRTEQVLLHENRAIRSTLGSNARTKCPCLTFPW